MPEPDVSSREPSGGNFLIEEPLIVASFIVINQLFQSSVNRKVRVLNRGSADAPVSSGRGSLRALIAQKLTGTNLKFDVLPGTQVHLVRRKNLVGNEH